ncbi:hypothetical protein [Listeria sp. PSOL-1]|uniref:hypothetical protein n=1 Tax=Listeria sp. PSOL-1 TaxID=1844999 RepID=UPI0013D19555|nr:hypothetical protein [Listeria sp. PSOL-1]
MRTLYTWGLNLLVLIVGLTICLYVYNNANAAGYDKLYLLPLTYVVVFFLVLSHCLLRRFNIFLIVFTGISFARYVILPCLIVYTGYYGGRSPEPPLAGSLHKAIYLMIYELIAIALTIIILELVLAKKWKPPVKAEELSDQSRRDGFLLFSVVGLIAVIVIPNAASTITFLFPKDGLVDVVSNNNTLSMLGTYLFIIAKQLLFLLGIYACHKGYKRTMKKRYLLAAVLLLIINIGIFVGTNRSDIVLSAIVSLIVFQRLFPRFFKWVAMGTGSLLVTIISLMGQVRNIASISGGNSALVDFTDNLQVYFGGPYNVALAVETKLLYPEVQNLSVLFFDIFRPMIGINVLVKNLPFTYSNIFFNHRYYYAAQETQILPIIGQGNIFFGYVAAPLFSVLTVCLAYYLCLKINRTRSLAMFYFLTLVCTRLGMVMGQNTMNIVNDLSYNLFLFLIIYALSSLFVFKRKEGESLK